MCFPSFVLSLYHNMQSPYKLVKTWFQNTLTNINSYKISTLEKKAFASLLHLCPFCTRFGTNWETWSHVLFLSSFLNKLETSKVKMFYNSLWSCSTLCKYLKKVIFDFWLIYCMFILISAKASHVVPRVRTTATPACCNCPLVTMATGHGDTFKSLLNSQKWFI